MSDLGGASKTVMFVFIFIISPFSEYSFKMKSFENMYKIDSQMRKKKKSARNEHDNQ